MPESGVHVAGRGPAGVGTAVLGGGPAGLTAAYMLARRGAPGTVFEAGGSVGGIARTVEWGGYRFDLGGHRFFTKLAPIARLWEEMLGDEFLPARACRASTTRASSSRTRCVARDVMSRLGVVESARCALSYLAGRSRGRAGDPAETFEDWVTERFGRRLYEAFFRSYTEKVWGIPGSEIRAEWAAQRIRNFSLFLAMLTILGLRRSHVTTLIEEFRYPRLGPGQMWQAFRDAGRGGRRAGGASTTAASRCTTRRARCGRSPCGPAASRRVTRWTGSSRASRWASWCRASRRPRPSRCSRRPPGCATAPSCLVALVTDEPQPFPDNWIYLHDAGVRAGRVQNFGAWSPDMVRRGRPAWGSSTSASRDDIWTMPRRRRWRWPRRSWAGSA